MQMVPNEIRKHRSQQMIAMGAEMTKVFIDSQIGKTRPVLFEGEHARGEMCGFTKRFIKCIILHASSRSDQWGNSVKSITRI